MWTRLSAPALLECEFAAAGLHLCRMERLAGSDSYFAAFEAVGERPEPSEACEMES